MTEITQISEALLTLEAELEKLKSAAALISSAGNAATVAVEAAASTTKALKPAASQIESLLKEVRRLAEEIDDVHFPARLDKLDATTSGVNAAIQNVIAQMRDLEKSTERAARSTDEGNKKILEALGAIQQGQENATRTLDEGNGKILNELKAVQQSQSRITWALGGIYAGGGAGILALVRHWLP